MNQKKTTIPLVLLWALFFTNTLIAQKNFDLNSIQKPIFKNGLLKKDTTPFERNLFYQQAKDGQPITRKLLYVPSLDGNPQTILLANDAALTHLNSSIQNKVFSEDITRLQAAEKK
jgi:hypothetical protein